MRLHYKCKVLHSICNMATGGLPDRFIISSRALGVHIRQTSSLLPVEILGMDS